ncbi:MAG: outer membrane protein assembly factor BamB, partial [Pseudomonadota bacterium]|nr:outer membrane protein assembly factor BamB [Pseudomonadota bacterium]
MNEQYFRSLALAVRAPLAIITVAILAGCFGGMKKPQPAELQPVTALVSARQSWNSRIGPVNFPLDVSVSGNGVSVASDDGTVALLDAQTGRDVWRVALKTPIAAGVGSDGKVLAVVTKANEVVA